VDVILPAEALLQVRMGDRVQGGASVIAAMPEAALAVVETATAEPAAILAEEVPA
jgi:hypothetical protein